MVDPEALSTALSAPTKTVCTPALSAISRKACNRLSSKRISKFSQPRVAFLPTSQDNHHPMFTSRTKPAKTSNLSQTLPLARPPRCTPTSPVRYPPKIFPPPTYRAIPATPRRPIRCTAYSRWELLSRKTLPKSSNFFSCRSSSRTMPIKPHNSSSISSR